MLTDKQIEREEAFCDDWYMVRKMGKTPTYADAIAWADKTMIEKVYVWLDEHWNDYFEEDEDFNGWHMMRDFRKTMEE